MYKKYTHKQLVAMQNVYYAGRANAWQAQKFEFICECLYNELLELNPRAKKKAPAYMQSAIECILSNRQEKEQEINDRMRANAHTAHQQLLNYDLAERAKERPRRRR